MSKQLRDLFPEVGGEGERKEQMHYTRYVEEIPDSVPAIFHRSLTYPNFTACSLGQSGLKISKVILGCMSYGDPASEKWVLDEEASLPLLEHAFKRGINTWDTADVYSVGKSEEIVGKAIKKYNIARERLVILTKCYFGVDEASIVSGRLDPAMVMTNDGYMVNRVGLSRKHIFDAVDASVKRSVLCLVHNPKEPGLTNARLGTYIDVYQIHRLDPDVPPEEIMKALNDVVESGKVRYLGASSVPCSMTPLSAPHHTDSERWLPGNSRC